MSNQNKPEDEYRQSSNEQTRYALGSLGALGAVTGLSYGYLNNETPYSIIQAERGLALDDVGASGLDPQFRKTYLDVGPFGLTTDQSVDRLKGLLPDGHLNYEPSDLSQAGKGLGITPGKNIKRQITVSPGVQPRRLSYEGLTDSDLIPGYGQKGYIWANPEAEQWSYAQGNFARGRVQSNNPAVNYLDVEMDPLEKTEFKTTDRLANDDSFNTQRRWGQRDYGNAGNEGDVMFPKENIKARREVTAADVYTDARNRGTTLTLGNFEDDPGKAFKELVDDAAETRRMTPRALLEELSTPVKPLGETPRFAGKLPQVVKFNTDGVDPDTLKKAGVGSVFIKDPDYTPIRDIDPKDFEKRLYIDSDPGGYRPNTRHFEINPALVNIRSRAGNFLRRQSGVGAMYGLDMAMNPDVIKALEEGDNSKAAMYAGGSVAAGVALESGVKASLAGLAKRGITTPLRVASASASPAAAIQILATAERTTPQTDFAALPDSDPRKQYLTKQKPTEVGKYGPDNAFADVPDGEEERIRNLPAKTQRVKALPAGNQAAYNINNERKYIQRSISEGKIPYFSSNNNRQDAKERTQTFKTPQRVMAVLNGKEGEMLQGDPSSFRMTNWSDDARKRYYGK